VGLRVGLAIGGYWALIDLQRAGTFDGDESFKRLQMFVCRDSVFSGWGVGKVFEDEGFVVAMGRIKRLSVGLLKK
jgi:hypothetical protein